MGDKCEVCINDVPTYIISCISCKNKQCAKCLFANDCKCCHCLAPVNQYKILMLDYSEELLELCIDRLSIKINKACKAYSKIFILEILFKDWLFSKQMLDMDISNTIIINFKKILKCIFNDSLQNCKESLRYLLTFNTSNDNIVANYFEFAIAVGP